MNRPSVLIVEPENRIAKLLALDLNDEGFTTFITSDFESSVAEFKANQPSIVITNKQLPGGSGIKLLSAIKEQNEATPVILIATDISQADATKVYHQGASAILLKPFEIDELFELINYCLHNPQYEKKRRLRRYPVSKSVVIDYQGERFDSEIGNISRGGMFVHWSTENCPPVGCLVNFKVNLADEILQARGIVRWAFNDKSSSGFGLQFVEMGGQQEAMLNSFIYELRVKKEAS